MRVNYPRKRRSANNSLRRGIPYGDNIYAVSPFVEPENLTSDRFLTLLNDKADILRRLGVTAHPHYGPARYIGAGLVLGRGLVSGKLRICPEDNPDGNKYGDPPSVEETKIAMGLLNQFSGARLFQDIPDCFDQPDGEEDF